MRHLSSEESTDSHLAVVGGTAALDGTLCALMTGSGRVRVVVVVVEMGMVLVGTVEGGRWLWEEVGDLGQVPYDT